MKKLLIAAALTASVCSFGANINATGFEADNSLADGYFNKGTSDASEVKSYEQGAAPAAAKATAAGADSIGSKYLSLSTEGDTLWRTINEYTTEEGVDITERKPAAATGTYIDTLVQFTATEEDPTTFDDDAKFAMWLKSDTVDETTTYTLKTFGASITWDSSNEVPVSSYSDDAKGTVFTLNTSEIAGGIKPSEWYRLTVKAVKIFTEAGYGADGYGFAIYIDGKLVKPVATAVSEDAINGLSAVLGDVKGKLQSNELIPSRLILETEDALYGVGFKGTGAIDSIAWTDDDLFQEVPAGFTLTIAFGDGVTAAEYTIGEAAAVTVTDGGEYTFNSGDEVVFSATVADWYLANSADKTVTVTKDDTVTLTATAVTANDANVVVPENSTVSADTVFAWAKGIEGVDLADVQGAKNIFNNYILNVANLAVDPQIEIVSINTTVNPVAVTAKVTDANGSSYEKVLEAKDLQGASLKYKAASTLEGLKNAKPKEDIEAGDQFIKVVVE